jgi:anti-anti-sigma factor
MRAEPAAGTDQHNFGPLLIEVFDVDEQGMQRVRVTGELDALTAPEVHKTVVSVLRRQCLSRIEIDLRGVTFLDSAGIRALLLCHSDAQRLECQLIVINPCPSVYRVLEITALLDHFGIVDTQPQPQRGC